MPRHFFGKFSGICVAVLLCLTIHYAQCDSLLRPELDKITLVCLINRHASGLQQVLKKFSESSCSLTQDLVRPVMMFANHDTLGFYENSFGRNTLGISCLHMKHEIIGIFQ